MLFTKHFICNQLANHAEMYQNQFFVNTSVQTHYLLGKYSSMTESVTRPATGNHNVQYLHHTPTIFYQMLRLAQHVVIIKLQNFSPNYSNSALIVCFTDYTEFITSLIHQKHTLVLLVRCCAINIPLDTGGVLGGASDLRGRGFKSCLSTIVQWPWASYLHLCVFIMKQYKLVPAKGQKKLVCVWVAGEIVWSHCYTRAVSEFYHCCPER